jgi:hypothetical protein
MTGLLSWAPSEVTCRNENVKGLKILILQQVVSFLSFFLSFFIHSFIYLFMYLLIYLFIYSFTHLFIYVCTYFCISVYFCYLFILFVVYATTLFQ